MVSVGVFMGLMIYVIIVGLGFGVVIVVFFWIFDVICWIGVVYLFYFVVIVLCVSM